MDALGKTSYVVLGMLQLGRRTGYEIKSLVDVSTRFFWAASYGQIYPELRRLEKLGLVRGQRDDSDGRRRRSFELTTEGEQALADWLASDEPLHIELRNEGMLKLFFSDRLSAAERADLWRRMGAAHAEKRDQLEALHPAAIHSAEQDGHRMPLEVLEFGIAFTAFISDWCERMDREAAASLETTSGKS
jgi:PadR family transcriptional regulator, regulatory protein AphA